MIFSFIVGVPRPLAKLHIKRTRHIQFYSPTEASMKEIWLYPFVCGRVPWLNQYWPGGFMVFVVLCPGTPEGSTGSGSGFKASQKTGQRLKVSSDRLREAGNRTCDPWFTRHRFIPYTTAASLPLSYAYPYHWRSVGPQL